MRRRRKEGGSDVCYANVSRASPFDILWIHTRTNLSNINEILIMGKDDGLETLAEATGITPSSDKSIF